MSECPAPPHGEPSPKRGYAGLLGALAAALVFTGIALWCVQPLLPQWNEAYAGKGELEGWLWRYWWMKQLIVGAWTAGSAKYAVYVALVSGSYPETGNVLDLQMFSMPLDALLGSPAYYNAKVVVILVLDGLAGYALARLLIKDWSSSVLCGFAFAFGTYVLLEIDTGRIRQAVLFPLALYAHALMRLTLDRTSLWRAALTGLAFGLCASMFLFYGMSAAFMSVLWLTWMACPPAAPADAADDEKQTAYRQRLGYLGALGLVTIGGLAACGAHAPSIAVGGLFAAVISTQLVMLARRDGMRRIAQLGVVLAVAVVTSLPYATWYIEQAFVRHQALPEMSWKQAFPTLEALENPHDVHTSDDALMNSMQRFRGDSFSWDYPFLSTYRRSTPLVLTALVIGGLLVFRGRPWLFVTIMLLGYVLSLGPYLKGGVMETYAAHPEGIRLPHTIFFEYVPYFSRLFSPIRLQGLFLLGFGVLAGWSTAKAYGRLRMSPPLRVLATAILIGLSLGQLARVGAIPIGMTPATVPDVYPWVAASDADGIIELPLREGDYGNYYQIFHGKRVLDGWAANSIPPGYPESRTRWLAQAPSNVNLRNTFLQWLRTLNEGSSAAAPSFAPSDLKQLAELGYRWVLLHERGCYIVKGPDGRAHYAFMRRHLDGLLGGPVRTSKERVREGGFGDVQPDADGCFTFEIVVYDLKPLLQE